MTVRARIAAEAREAVLPPAEHRDGPLVPTLLALSVVTGLVDAYSYLVLGHVFVANMTGNIVFLGFALAGSAGFSLTASLTALAAFVVGAFAGGALSRSYGSHRGRHLFVATAIDAVLLGAAVVVAAAASSPERGAARFTLIVLLGFGMGIQNATARRLAVPDLTTTVLTLTITGIFADTKVLGGPGARVGRRVASTTAIFLGALVGALLAVHGAKVATLAIVLVLVAGVAVVMHLLSSRDAPWTAAR